MDIAAIRKEYTQLSLSEQDVQKNPIKQFDIWFKQTIEAKVAEPNAMTLSTVSAEGKPSSRIVLLKGFDKNGFVFYTNYGSRKGKELEQNSNASLLFFWPDLERQVRIEGKATKIPVQESMHYFFSRPVTSQMGAWASLQSAVIEGRAALEKKFSEIKDQFSGKQVPFPSFWGGYRIEPTEIEFWQGRPSRLHDRILYSLTEENQSWSIERLQP